MRYKTLFFLNGIIVHLEQDNVLYVIIYLLYDHSFV